MVSSDGRYALVFNGEIYNYVERRAILEDKGFRFRSRSDTEVLLYAYAAWQVARCRGLVGRSPWRSSTGNGASLFCATRSVSSHCITLGGVTGGDSLPRSSRF